MASFSERYHELTKYNPHTIDRLGPVHWEHQPPPFKSISSQEKIDLISRLEFLTHALEGETSAAREEADPEAGASEGLDTIARLVFFTLGLTARLSQGGGHDVFLRAAPSAGGLYPTEIYVAARDQEGMADGIYHYHSLKSALIPVWQGSFWGDLKHYFLGHPAVDASGLIVLFTGLYGRSAWRYKERAYRRILLDTGHAVGNLLEVCRHSGLEYSLLGGFLDAGLEELLFLGPKEEFPLLGVAVAPHGLPPHLGQYPGEAPAEAVRHLDSGDAMQMQQNSCERIRAREGLRPPVARPCPGPDFAVPAGYPLFQTILRRRSCRKFTGAAVSLAQAAETLAYAFRTRGTRGGEWCLAPGRLDFHLVALNVEGLEPGVYALDPARLGGLEEPPAGGGLELTPKRRGDFKSESYFMCLGQELAADCAFLLVYTANLATLAEAYGDRGYRYACMDAGQIGQRINLWAVHQGLGSSGIGGYYDDQANELLELPLSHGVLYITLVGVPEAE